MTRIEPCLPTPFKAMRPTSSVDIPGVGGAGAAISCSDCQTTSPLVASYQREQAMPLPCRLRRTDALITRQEVLVPRDGVAPRTPAGNAAKKTLRRQLMKVWSFLFLAVGVALLLLGIFMWESDHRNMPYKLVHLVFPFIPAWSLLIMGWTGVVAENALMRFRE
jgi:hypothetical protein